MEMENQVSDGERTMERWVGVDHADGKGELERTLEGQV